MTGGRVELVGLVKRFGEDTAVDGISLDIPGGEFFSILGPSGCGKTTTLRMIAGFERPDEGRILLDGRDMAQTPPHRRPVNTVFQNYALFPHLSVGQNVELRSPSGTPLGSHLRSAPGMASGPSEALGIEAQLPAGHLERHPADPVRRGGGVSQERLDRQAVDEARQPEGERLHVDLGEFARTAAVADDLGDGGPPSAV
jgi:hypothetical protein